MYGISDDNNFSFVRICDMKTAFPDTLSREPQRSGQSHSFDRMDTSSGDMLHWLSSEKFKPANTHNKKFHKK